MRGEGGQLWRRLREAFASRRPFGLRAGLSVGIPLVAGALSHHASYGALASIGSFAGFYGPDAPYRHRIRLVAGVGVALTVLVPLGSLCAATAWLSVVLIGLVATTASFTYLTLRVPPPREYLIVLGVLAATGHPSGPTGPNWSTSKSPTTSRRASSRGNWPREPGCHPNASWRPSTASPTTPSGGPTSCYKSAA